MAFVLRSLLLLLFTLSVVDVAPIYDPGWVCANTTRQVRSAAEKELQTLIYTIKHKLLPEIRAMYPHQSGAKRKSCPRVNKLINSIGAEKDIVLAHKKFHLALMEMAFFIDQVEKFSFGVEFIDFKPIQDARQEIYATTKTKLALVICEFRDIIASEYNATVFDFDSNAKRINCIPKHPDLSQIGALDMQYFTKLRRLFKTGKAILKKLKRKSNASKQHTQVKKAEQKRAKRGNKKVGKKKALSQ